MRDPRQSAQPEQTTGQQAQTSIPPATAVSGSGELAAEELEERIAPLKQVLRR